MLLGIESVGTPHTCITTVDNSLIDLVVFYFHTLCQHNLVGVVVVSDYV